MGSVECVVRVSIMDNPSSCQAWVTFTDTDTHTPLIQYSNNNKAQHGASTAKTTSVSPSPPMTPPWREECLSLGRVWTSHSWRTHSRTSIWLYTLYTMKRTKDGVDKSWAKNNTHKH